MSNTALQQHQDGLIKRHEARTTHLGGISGATQWRWEKEGRLPKPIKLGNSSYYRLKELLASIEAMQ